MRKFVRYIGQSCRFSDFVLPLQAFLPSKNVSPAFHLCDTVADFTLAGADGPALELDPLVFHVQRID